MDEFFSKDPAPVLKKYISTKEMDLLGIGTKKKQMAHVHVTDFMLLDSMKNGKKSSSRSSSSSRTWRASSSGTRRRAARSWSRTMPATCFLT